MHYSPLIFAIPQVDPKHVFLISVLLEDWLQALLKTIDGGLACAEDWEARQLKFNNYDICQHRVFYRDGDRNTQRFLIQI